MKNIIKNVALTTLLIATTTKLMQLDKDNKKRMRFEKQKEKTQKDFIKEVQSGELWINLFG